MIVQYCSDLHLEFYDNKKWLEANPIKPVGDILILAGDTAYLGQQFAEHDFFDFVSKSFKTVYLIPGNHEFYGKEDVSNSFPQLNKLIAPNVWLVNNLGIEIESIHFIFTTLWSEIKKDALEVMLRVNDFRQIKYKGNVLTIEMFNHLHHQSLEFLKRELVKFPNRKKVVVTHHLPSPQCNAEKYINDKLNEAFCVDLTDLIKQSNVDYWLYGHSHHNKPKFRIGQTTMLTNQLGYVRYRENEVFNLEAVFEI